MKNRTAATLSSLHEKSLSVSWLYQFQQRNETQRLARRTVVLFVPPKMRMCSVSTPLRNSCKPVLLCEWRGGGCWLALMLILNHSFSLQLKCQVSPRVIKLLRYSLLGVEVLRASAMPPKRMSTSLLLDMEWPPRGIGARFVRSSCHTRLSIVGFFESSHVSLLNSPATVIKEKISVKFNTTWRKSKFPSPWSSIEAPCEHESNNNPSGTKPWNNNHCSL